MDRAIFTSREFLILSLALNHSMTDIFRNGMPGYSRAEMSLLKDKVHRLGMAGAQSKPPQEEVFTVRDDSKPNQHHPWRYPRSA